MSTSLNPPQEVPANPPEESAAVGRRLEEHLYARPHLAERIHRELLMDLHRRQIASIDSIQDAARRRMGAALYQGGDPNQAERDRWDERERQLVNEITRDHVARYLSIADVDDIVNLALKREEVFNLEVVANRNNVPFRELVDKIQRFCRLPLGETRLAPAEVVGTRVALIRHLVSDQLEFIGIAKNHLTIRDFDDITARILGSDTGMGRIGGKAGGMTLAHRILQEVEKDEKDPYLPLAVPESWYLRSDVIEDFIRLNRLDEFQSQKYKPLDEITREYDMIKGVFRNGEFPLKVVHELRRILDQIGPHPLVVRSSSLLEDRVGTAFCGKYASVFVANQGTLEQRLRALLGAIAEVYASIMGPDPILYRREHNLIDYVEEMAVLIQKVVGFRFGPYFLPAFAGVAFSRNEHRWSPRIKRDDGLLRVVMGLGTRAVDRSGSDYPRMVSLGEPELRPESSVQEIRRCAQHTIEVVDLQRNRLTQVRLAELLEHGMDFPMLDKIVSVHRDGELFPPPGQFVDANPADLCVTFDKLLRQTPFVERLRKMVARLESVYKIPIDLEFACDGERFYLLQCRTQSQALAAGPVAVPDNVPPRDIIFDAKKYVRTGLLEKLEYIVYVDAEAYDALPTRARRMELAHAVGRVNHALPPKSFVLMGPGRWGNNDASLGVPARYADINHCALLVEIARQKGSFSPEVSFGTHFFQDLVEAKILYLPLYPDEPGNQFNASFLEKSENILPRLVPADAEFAGILRVIHVPATAGGRRLTVAMDGETDRALAYLK